MPRFEDLPALSQQNTDEILVVRGGTPYRATIGGGNEASATPPPSPQPGDRWQETDSNGYPIEEWFWHAPGGSAYAGWLSTRIYEHTPSFEDSSSAYQYASVSYYLPLPDQKYGIFPLSWAMRYSLTADATASEYWDVRLYIRAGMDSLNGLGAFITQSDPAGHYAVDVPVAVPTAEQMETYASSQFLFCQVLRQGVPPNLYSDGLTLYYRRARDA